MVGPVEVSHPQRHRDRQGGLQRNCARPKIPEHGIGLVRSVRLRVQGAQDVGRFASGERGVWAPPDSASVGGRIVLRIRAVQLTEQRIASDCLRAEIYGHWVSRPAAYQARRAYITSMAICPRINVKLVDAVKFALSNRVICKTRESFEA